MAKEIKEKVKTAPSTITEQELNESVEQLESAPKEEVVEEKPKTVKEVQPAVELSPEEKIMKYVEDAHSDTVDLVPVLRSLYPMPTIAEPAAYLLQNESKKIKFILGNMVQERELKLVDETFLLLGKAYWKDGDTKTQHHNINSLKIMAEK